MAGEVREIKCAWTRDRTPRCLSTPSGDHPKPSIKPRVQGGPHEQSLPGEIVETDPVVFAQVATFRSNQDARGDLTHDTGGNSGGRVARLSPRCMQARGFWLIKKVKRGNDPIGYKLSIERESEVGSVAINPLPTRLVNKTHVRFGIESEP